MEQVNKEVERQSDDEDDDDSWQDLLQCYRMLIVDRIQYSTFISAALQSVKVLDQEDDQELTNPYTFRTSKMRTNGLVDILLRKGKENYKKFLQVLGIFYPDVYTEITGNNPPDATNLPFLPNPGGHDNQELIQLLMQALEGMKQKAFENMQMLKKSNHISDERAREIERLKKESDDLSSRVNRYETIDSEMVSLRSEVDRLKNENYTICMRMIDSNEENRQLRVSNNTLKNEKDKLTLDLQKAKRSMDLETSKSVRLRHKLDNGPSERDIMGMRREIDELKLKLAKANSNQEKMRDEDIDMRIQILQKDKEEALDMYEEAVENLHKLRESCAAAEAQRDKYLDEKEQLTLTCTVLQSDCGLYKKRRDTMWQELQEVEKEREMLMKERNEAQLNTKMCMEEKARYRTEIRELERKYDELSQKNLESERELIRMQRQVRRNSAEKYKWENDLSKIPNSYPSSTSSPPPNSGKALSEPTSEAGQFRQRAYITKYYAKYVSKPKEILNGIVEDLGQGLATVFPEIALASDFPKRKRRLALNRRMVGESSVGESVSSACEDET